MNRPVRMSLWIGFVFGIAMLLARADYYYGGYGRPSPYAGSVPYANPYSYFQPQSASPPISLDLNPQDNLNSAFRIAAREDRFEDMKGFLHQGAEVNSRSDTGETALMYAARNCSEPVVKYLLSRRADVNLRNGQGATALILAVEDSCLPVVKLLLGVPGLRLTQKDRLGKTAYDYAAEQTEAEVGGPPDEIVRLLEKNHRPAGGRERL